MHLPKQENHCKFPGPLIRVPEGTFINAKVHNTIPGSPLILHGFYSHPGNAKDSVSIPYGDTYKVRFKADKAGTYFYWASDSNLKSPYNGLPFLNDSQLFRAFIVDRPNAKPDLMERIFMIGLWNDTTKGVYSNDHQELTLIRSDWFMKKICLCIGELLMPVTRIIPCIYMVFISK